MPLETHLSSPEEVEFFADHCERRLKSNNETISLSVLGRTPEPNVEYFSLSWGTKSIGVRAVESKKQVGRSEDGQPIFEVQWIIEQIGGPGGPVRNRLKPYNFISRDERIVATNLIIKALGVYGGTFDNPRFNYFPIFRKIDVTLSDALKKDTYGELS
ncbi:MAG: hypothetical protein RIC14_11915 [Filomicrobium sp.]